jgi:DNA-binding GntR family transcriptional regulator
MQQGGPMESLLPFRPSSQMRSCPRSICTNHFDQQGSDFSFRNKLYTITSEYYLLSAGRMSAFSPSVQRVIDYMHTSLTRGTVAPGQRLAEAALSHELGIGRVPVREAIRTLVGDGILAAEPNKGARVVRYSVIDLIQLMRVLGALHQAGIREALTRRRTVQWINRARTAFQDAKKHGRADNWPAFLLVLDTIHDIINAESMNVHLIRVVRRMHPALIYLNLGPALYGRSIEPHLEAYKDMMTALSDDDERAANGAYCSHMEALIAALTAYPMTRH